jgi:hypothetical protein
LNKIPVEASHERQEVEILLGWSDERIWGGLAKSPQTFVLNFQRKIKEAFEPNSLGDRNYPWLPEGWGKTVETTTAK